MRDENVARINCNAINCILLLNTKNKIKINTQQQTQNIIAKRLLNRFRKPSSQIWCKVFVQNFVRTTSNMSSFNQF